MSPSSVSAKIRESRGKNAARRLRVAGEVPAVLYGNKQAPLSVSINPKEVSSILHSAAGHNTIFTLEIESRSPESVMLKDWQLDPITGKLLHADLVRIAMDQTLEVEVPIHAVGEATGVKLGGGILEFVVREIEVECLPNDIPERITIDISHLDIGGTYRVADLPLDPKLKILSEPGLVIAHVIAPKEEKAPEPTAEVVATAEPEVIKKGKVTAEGESAEGKPEEKKEKEKK
ncbi:MAG: 50S ribosomal protein L25 [Acidobacteriota bacterium]